MTIGRGTLVGEAPPAEYVRRMAALGFDVTVDALSGKSRERPLVNYRHVTMTAIRHLCRLSYPAIGAMFDGRDHTTVMHAVAKVDGGKHHPRGSEKRRWWEVMDRLCDEVRRQWAVDTGRAFPDPGQLQMETILDGMSAPDLLVVFS